MRLPFAVVVFLGSISGAHSQECLARFQEILMDQSDKGAFKILAEQEIKGGMKSKNYFYQAKSGHWMTKAIEPENMQWTLVHDDVMYSSSDKGASWQKVREMDSAANQAAVNKSLTENAKTARDTICIEETVDGVRYEKVSGTYDTVSGFKATNSHVYWINLDTGWLEKAYYEMSSESFSSKTTQTIEKLDFLELPMPE